MFSIISDGDESSINGVPGMRKVRLSREGQASKTRWKSRISGDQKGLDIHTSEPRVAPVE